MLYTIHTYIYQLHVRKSISIMINNMHINFAYVSVCWLVLTRAKKNLISYQLECNKIEALSDKKNRTQNNSLIHSFIQTNQFTGLR